MTQSFLTYDSMERPLKCDHSFECYFVVLYCGPVFFDSPQMLNFGNFGFGTLRSKRVDTKNKFYDNKCFINGFRKPMHLTLGE